MVVAALVAAFCLALVGSASAAPAAVADSGLVPFAPPGAINSDCGIAARLVNDSATGSVQAYAWAQCSGNKNQVYVRSHLKKTGTDGSLTSWWTDRSITVPQWVRSDAQFNGCDRWQAIAQVWITDRYGRQTYNYVTTGVPRKFNDHCPY
jgi:hypothetical protein